MRVENRFFHYYKFKNVEPISATRKLKKFAPDILKINEKDLKDTIKDKFPEGYDFKWRERERDIIITMMTKEYDTEVENQLNICKAHSTYFLDNDR